MYTATVCVLLGFFGSASGVSCSSSTVSLSASSSAQSLLSPGYPSDYENNQNCKWLISTQDLTKRIQIEIISVNIANWNGGECEDYLELRDGQTDDSHLIKKLCSSEQFQFKSKGQHLLVKFISDQHITAPGFALKYYHISEYKSQCDPYGVRTLSVGQNPLFLDLPMYAEKTSREITCDFHIKSEFNDDVTINLDILTFSPILCEDGSFSIHDGPNDHAPIILEWCYSNQPFQNLASSGKDLFLRFRLTKTEGEWFVYRAKLTTKIKSTSCSDKSPPNLELSALPTYLAFPHQVKLKSTRACPLRFWTEKPSQTVRLEVVSKEPHCGNRGVRVYDGYDFSNKALGTFCDKTIYTSTTANLMLHPVNENFTGTVYVKVSAVDAMCNGKVDIKTANYDEIHSLPEIANPKTHYAHDLNCSFLLQSDRRSDAIEVMLMGRMVPKGTYKCEGDDVTVYDGDNLTSPIISVWCGALEQKNKLTSTGPKMLVVFRTDGHDGYEGAKLMYYAVPQLGSCKLVTELEANNTHQHFTSPNYPLYYPINSYCEYKIKAPKGHAVHLEVTHSKMEHDCSDTVQVYEGLEKKLDKYLGRWCGDEKPKYRSSGNEVLIAFSADNEFNSGGFNVTFYSYKEIQKSYLVPATVGSTLFAVAIIIIVIILYIFIVRKKRLLRAS
ncbi:unnamed protein product [Lymnaea stagnalis]|uniref:CUB domain-containing protein n=1 Tax=Lymnaea stagnalis TaxID=6523 RepID=A0AAV2IEW2_LYMST